MIKNPAVVAVLMFIVAVIQFTVKTPPSFVTPQIAEVLGWIGGILSLALSIFAAAATQTGQAVVQSIKARFAARDK